MAALEAEACERVFNASPERAKMDTAHAAVDAAKSEAAVDAVRLK